MSDISAFITAELDMEEAAARAATPGPWRAIRADAADKVPFVESAAVEYGKAVAHTQGILNGHVDRDEADARHIALHNPQRVLADIAAKRKILAAHKLAVEKVRLKGFDPFTGEQVPDQFSVECETCGWAGDDPASGCLTVRLLAMPFAGKPDYRKAWSVSG